MLDKKGQNIKFQVHMYQDSNIYIKIQIYISRFKYTYIKIQIYISRFKYMYQDHINNKTHQ